LAPEVLPALDDLAVIRGRPAFFLP